MQVEVTDADRDAAADWLHDVGIITWEGAGRIRLGLEAAAGAMENLCFFTDIEELMEMTKQDMSVRTCHQGATAIRAIDPAVIGKV